MPGSAKKRSEYEFFKDGSNAFYLIRKYRITNASGDTSGTTEYYYDEKGILRFIYNEFGAVNGTAGAYRIYFDETGKQIYIKPPAQGPFGSSVEPPEEIKNPKEHFERICKQWQFMAV